MKKATYQLEQFEACLQTKSWFAWLSGMLFTTKRVSYLFANYTKITPNQVTFLSVVSGILGALSFVYGYFILGAILFWVAYMLDCVDGAVARVTGQTSPSGGYVDVVSDHFKVFVVFFGLAWGYFNHMDANLNIWILFNYLFFVFMYDFTAVNWLSIERYLYERKMKAKEVFSGKNDKNRIKRLLNSVINYFSKNNIKPIWGPADLCSVLFVIIPIFFMDHFITSLIVINVLFVVYYFTEMYAISSVLKKISK